MHETIKIHHILFSKLSSQLANYGHGQEFELQSQVLDGHFHNNFI